MEITFSRYVLLLSVITILFVPAVHKAHGQLSMPIYDRLQPVTAPVSAPTDVALDRHENIYVVESVNNKLMVFSQSGQYQATMPGLDKPLSVAVDSGGRIFIANENRGNVEVFDADLIFQFKLNLRDGEFVQPNDIAIDGAGRIFVVDKGDDTVKVYNIDGTFSFAFGGTGSDNGHFNKPLGIAIDDAASEVAVLDRQLTTDSMGGQIEGARIQIFDLNGAFQRGFSKYGNMVGQLFRPQRLAMDGEGRIYVTDSFHNVVIVYDKSDGTHLGDVFDLGYPLRSPIGIAMSSSNRLFIASLITGRVEVYGISPYTNMTVSPLTLYFEGMENTGSPDPQWISIDNSGTEVLDWTAGSNQNWIVLPVMSGSTAGSATDTLETGIDLSGLLPGAYYGEVTVTAASGAREIVDVRLNVLPGGTAADPGGPYAGTEGQALLLDGSGSGGNPLLYEWDVDYDGLSASFEYSTSSPTQVHTYASDGTYSILLRITTDGGTTDTAVTTADIMDSVPSPDFIGSPLSGASPLAVSFLNYSAGYDQPLQFAWDFDSDGVTDSTEADPVHTYPVPGIYTVTLTVTDGDGSTNSLTRYDYVSVSAQYTLTVITSGSGTVTSVPAGIDCGIDCSESYGDVTLVTMTALPDAGSYFAGWSGSCTGSGSCQVMMNADHNVTALFDTCQNPPVKVAGPISSYQTSLQGAYDAASNGDVVQSQAARFTEDLLIDMNKSVLLEGGYSCDYVPGNVLTVISGSVTISSGSVTMENIRIE